MDPMIVIPALNPGRGLIEYVDRLRSRGYKNILVVDDGSRDDCRYIFDEIEAKDGCEVLRHEVNMGKGRALKDAMTWFLDRYGAGAENHDIGGIITVDSDGQHIVEDVDKVAAAMKAEPDSLILGARDFNTDNVPSKSRFGNKCTIVALKLFIGGDIHDTQTGLRGIPEAMIERFSLLPGDRFEYETQMLIDAIHSNIRITEVPIQTVYINDNSETHFNPIKDSVRIYSVILGTFLKYTLSSLSSFLIDYGMFCLLLYILSGSGTTKSRSIWIATIVARICSSLFNYTVNKKIVFKSRRGPVTIAMYFCLCAVQAAASAALVSLLSIPGILPPQISKMIVDTVLFVISYRVQKGLIFTDRK